jgi:hypothetical protein
LRVGHRSGAEARRWTTDEEQEIETRNLDIAHEEKYAPEDRPLF